MRDLTLLDHMIGVMDEMIRVIFVPPCRVGTRPSPAEGRPHVDLTARDTKHVAGLMRVNHAGEVCAQALYRGQSLTATLPMVQQQMMQSAQEEMDHLAWCETRLHELGAKPSVLSGFWYFGSLMLGAFAGLVGDRWSLGFVVETERQVSMHLQSHLAQLPLHDEKTRIILKTMDQDEQHHAEIAQEAGANVLPWWIQKMMQGASKVMTLTSYYV